MIGLIERIKNAVLLKCSTLNDNLITETLSKILETRIYRFAEELVSMIGNNLSEEETRKDVSNVIRTPIIKKIKRKLFIDSLALQITNDTFIEDYVNNKLSLDDLKKKYKKELKKNKSSNQLNMTEDLNLSEIINDLKIYVDKNIINLVSENETLVNSIKKLTDDLEKLIEQDLEKMINDADDRYLNILLSEIEKECKEKEGEDKMLENVSDLTIEDLFGNNNLNSAQPETENHVEEETPVMSSAVLSKFENYDDMTLYNKMILCLNTAEEKLTRRENKIKARKEDVEKRLSETNKNIEANIERENALSQRKLDLNSKEVEINSKLSETEVIFLNMKPLIKGLSKIKDSSENGGSENE